MDSPVRRQYKFVRFPPQTGHKLWQSVLIDIQLLWGGKRNSLWHFERMKRMSTSRWTRSLQGCKNSQSPLLPDARRWACSFDRRKRSGSVERPCRRAASFWDMLTLIGFLPSSKVSVERFRGAPWGALSDAGGILYRLATGGSDRPKGPGRFPHS